MFLILSVSIFQGKKFMNDKPKRIANSDNVFFFFHRRTKKGIVYLYELFFWNLIISFSEKDHMEQPQKYMWKEVSMCYQEKKM